MEKAVFGSSIVSFVSLWWFVISAVQATQIDYEQTLTVFTIKDEKGRCHTCDLQSIFGCTVNGPNIKRTVYKSNYYGLEWIIKDKFELIENK